MKVKVLGPLMLANGSSLVDVGGPRQRRLLAALTLHSNSVVSTDSLVEIVFGEFPPSGAKTTLRSYIARLRSSMRNTDCPDAIVTESGGYRLQLEPEQCDAETFTRRLAGARTLVDRGGAIDAASELRHALGMWRGPAYGDLAAEQWFRSEAVRLDELRIDAEELLIEAQMECGATRDVIPDLTRLVDLHPFRDALRGHLMLALYRSGRQAEALRSYDHHRNGLVEIGLEPGDDLALLAQRIAQRDPNLDLDIPAGTPLRGYRLGHALREDRFGVTYRGVQPGTRRPVAVRAMRGSAVDSAVFIRNFDRLVRSLTRLEHPHLVPIHDFWREFSGAYIVMRPLPRTLEQLIASGPASIPQVRTIVWQAARAMTAAHRMGLVHGALDLANVHLDDEGTVFLADFGLRELFDDRPLQRNNSVAYEAPELVGGSAATRASDQYSLAVITAHLLTGTPPKGLREVLDGSAAAASLGLPAALEPVVAIALAPNPQDRYPTVAEFASATIEALGGNVPVAPDGVDIANPFRGLEPFSEADASRFFGREAVVDELAARLGDEGTHGRFVALVGASGTGKSSAVHAGLLPRVRDGAIPGSVDWLVATMTPGDDPVGALAAALSSIAATSAVPSSPAASIGEIVRSAVPQGRTALVVVDQLEELFTLAPPVACDAFLNGIAEVVEAPSRDVRVVTTLRADFYDRPLHHGAFGRLVANNTMTLAGMTPEELARALRMPALASGVEIEPDVIAQLVAAATNDVGALPLVQFTLTELFDRRQGAVIDASAYEQLGGFETILATQADALVDGLSADDQDLVRRLFLLLVTVDRDGAVVRNRVLRSELASLGSVSDSLDQLLAAFDAARLLTFDQDPTTREPTVQIAHEALTTRWPRLDGWIREQGDGLRTHSELRAAAAVWKSEDRDESCLYRGARLEGAQAWHERNAASLAQTEQEFLDASIELREHEAAAARARQADDARRRRRSLILTLSLGVAALAAVAAVLVASKQQDRADEEARSAAVVGLVAASADQAAKDPELSVLLALEAVRLGSAEPNGGPVEALHSALRNHRLLSVLHIERDVPEFTVTLSPSGSRLVTGGSDATVAEVWSTASLDVVHELVGHTRPVNQATFSADGELIATASLDGSVRIWDATTGAEIAVLRTDDGTPTFVPAFGPNGSVVAASSPGGRVFVWDIGPASLDHVLPSLGGEAPWTFGLAFSPDGTELAVASNTDNMSGVLAVWDWANERLEVALDAHDAAVSDVEYSPDGRRLYSASWDGRISEWDTTTLELNRAFTAQPAGVNAISVSGDGHRIAAAGIDGVAVWDTATLTSFVPLIGHSGGVEAVELSGAGNVAVTSSIADGTVRIWNAHDANSEVGTWRGVPASEHATAPLLGGIAASTNADLVVAVDNSIAASSISGSGISWEYELLGSRVSALALGSEGSTIVAASDEGVFVIDAQAGSVELVPDAAGATALAVDASGGRVAWGGEGAGILSLQNGETQTLVDASLRVADIAVGPGTSPMVAVAHGSVAAASGEEDLSPSVVELFDGESGEPRGALGVADDDGHTRSVTALAFDSAGERVATASADGSALIWDVAALSPIVRLTGHSASVNDVAFDPTRNELATGSADATVKIWNAASGELFLTLRTAGPVTDIAYSPDGTYLVATNEVGSVNLFIVDVELLVEEAGRRTDRTLTARECDVFLPGLPCEVD